MSYVELLGVRSDMTTTKLLALHNAAHWAIDLWAHLYDAHIEAGLDYGERFVRRERVWPLSDDPRVPLAHRRVLGMTFERAIVRAADYAQAASDMRQAPAGAHWPSIAQFVEDGGAAGFPMIGFRGHSGDAPTFSEPYEERDEYGDQRWRPIDPATVYDVYAEIR